MKLDAVFFNLIPRVNRDVARLDLQLAFVSEACQYAVSYQNIPPVRRLRRTTQATERLLYLTLYSPFLARFHFTIIFL